MGGEKALTQADIIAQMRIQNDVWKERRKIARMHLMLALFTTMLSVLHIAWPRFISPFQHILTGVILGRMSFRTELRNHDVRSLWALQSMILVKAAITRCRPLHDGDFAFVSCINDTLGALDPDDRSTYGPHLERCMEMLPTVSAEPRALLAAHVALLGHAAPRRGRRSWRRRTSTARGRSANP